MGVALKWQVELVAIAWINIGLIVMSLPMFSIYIVESLQGENPENFMLRTHRGHHFVEIIVKYFASLLFWIPMSIMLKIGAAKRSFTLIKICGTGSLIFVFLLALQLILEPPQTILVVCAYAICFVYLISSVWLMKNFVDELRSEKGDITPVLNNTLNSDSVSNCNSENLDELNDVADQRTVFRLQPISSVCKNAIKV